MAFHSLCFAACDTQIDVKGARPDEICMITMADFPHQALHNHLFEACA